MSNRLRWLFAVFAVGALAVALLYSVVGRPQHRPLGPSVAEQLRDAGLKQAQKQNKRLLLWFSSASSEWCQLLDQFHQDPEVAAIYNRYFVNLKIDVDDTPGGLVLYSYMGNDRGVPAFTILTGDGQVLADSGTEDQQHNVGFPTDDEQRSRFLTALKTACPQITDDELSRLSAKLKEIFEPNQAEANLPPEQPTASSHN